MDANEKTTVMVFIPRCPQCWLDRRYGDSWPVVGPQHAALLNEEAESSTRRSSSPNKMAPFGGARPDARTRLADACPALVCANADFVLKRERREHEGTEEIKRGQRKRRRLHGERTMAVAQRRRRRPVPAPPPSLDSTSSPPPLSASDPGFISNSTWDMFRRLAQSNTRALEKNENLIDDSGPLPARLTEDYRVGFVSALLDRAAQQLPRNGSCLVPGGSLLDVGGADGSLDNHIARIYGTRTRVYDIVPPEDNVHALQRRVPASLSSLPRMQRTKIRLFDGWKVPEPDASWDCVSLFYVLHHASSMAEAASLIHEAARVSRRYVFVAEDLESKRFHQRNRHHDRGGSRRGEFRNASAWVRAFQEHGLTVKWQGDMEDDEHGGDAAGVLRRGLQHGFILEHKVRDAEHGTNRGLMGAPPTQDLMTATEAVTQLERKNVDPKLEKRLRGRKSDGEGGEGRCDAATVEQYLLPSKWQGYRFNDWFVNSGRLGENLADWETLKCVSKSEWERAAAGGDCDAHMVRPFFPDSLFAQYHKRSVETHGGWNNITLLKTVVAAAITRAPAQAKGPPLNTVVIHVRVGDVIDMAPASVAALLHSPHYFFADGGDRAVLLGQGSAQAIRQKWNQYVAPLAFFRDVIDKGEIQPRDKVVLMAASHEDVGLLRRGAKPLPEKSCVYLNRVREFFVGHGIQTTIRVGHTPDEDIMYAAQSRRFVRSHGGFSELLGRLVAAFGGDASRPLRPFRTLTGTIGNRTFVRVEKGVATGGEAALHVSGNTTVEASSDLEPQVAARVWEGGWG